jgi:hypothetical protein
MKVTNIVAVLAMLNVGFAYAETKEESKQKTEQATTATQAETIAINGDFVQEEKAENAGEAVKKHNPHKILNTKFISRRPYMEMH